MNKCVLCDKVFGRDDLESNMWGFDTGIIDGEQIKIWACPDHSPKKLTHPIERHRAIIALWKTYLSQPAEVPNAS